MSKRVEQKAAARVVRDQLAKEQRRKRTVWITVATAFTVAVVGLLGWAIWDNAKRSDYAVPAGANEGGTGYVSGSGPVLVEDYVDFLCPYCKDFHDDAHEAIAQLVIENKITYVQHTVAYLDRASTNQYSTRSAAAGACAADGGKFDEYAGVLFANQPAEGGPGPDNAQLISYGAQIGLGAEFESCINDRKYVSWTKHVNDGAAEAEVTSTPTVLVNGEKVPANAAAITTAVAAAG